MTWRYVLVAANALTALWIVVDGAGDLLSLAVASVYWLTAWALLSGRGFGAWLRVTAMLFNGLLAFVVGIVVAFYVMFFEFDRSFLTMDALGLFVLPVLNCFTLGRAKS